MVDRTTKLLLGAIALGIWMVVLQQADAWEFRRSEYSKTLDIAGETLVSSGRLERMEEHLEKLYSEIDNISSGTCMNQRLCP